MLLDLRMSSDDDDGDDFVVFGTALAPIEDEEVPRKKPVPIEEQARDWFI